MKSSNIQYAYTLNNPNYYKDTKSSIIDEHSNLQHIYNAPQPKSNILDDISYPSKCQNVHELQDNIEQERRQFRQIHQKLSNQLEFDQQHIEQKLKQIHQQEQENKQLQEKIKVNFQIKYLKFTIKFKIIDQDHEQKLQQMIKENHLFEQQKIQNQQYIMNHSEQSNVQLKKMQEVIEYGAQQYDLMESQFNQQQQKKDASHRIQTENHQREFDFKHKNLDEKCQSTLGHCRLLENEIKVLNETILKMRLRQEEEIKEVSVKVQEEEYKKWIQGLKLVENKIASQEKINQQLVQELHLIHQQIQDYNQQIHSNQINHEFIHQQKATELTDLNHQIENHGLMMNHYQNENNIKLKKHGQLQNEYKNCQVKHQIFDDQANLQLDKQKKGFNDELKFLNDHKNIYMRKLADLEYFNQKKDKEYNMLKQEYDRITESIQNNIHKTIYQTVQDVNTNQSKFPKPNINDRFVSKY